MSLPDFSFGNTVENKIELRFRMEDVTWLP